MRSRVLALPAVQELDDFAALVAQMGHYFSHIKPERVTIMVDSRVWNQASTWLSNPRLPGGYGESVLTRVGDLRGKINLTSWPCNLDRVAAVHDLIIDWNVIRSDSEPWKSAKSKYRRNRTLFEVDWRAQRQGAAWFAEAAKLLTLGREFHPAAQENMAELCDKLGQSRHAYVIGTGPSAREALNFDLSDGARIVCNTIILDDELMEHIHPQVLTFADPIFHFGPSTYAQRFQQKLVEQAERFEFSIVTTERYAPLLTAHAPQLSHRVIGLRQGTQNWPDSLNLQENPAVRPYPNVLTMLMLPLAATLSESIVMLGFDGRGPTDEYFWRHGPTVQFDDELVAIRDVHPGFFDIDYTDYYDTHVTALDRMLTRIELRGTSVAAMTESHMPPLRRRRVSPSDRSVRATRTTSKPLLVSVTPDWIDDFGHFGPLERRIHDGAIAAGFHHVSLASRGLEPVEEWQIPTFSERTFSTVVGVRFEPELSESLSSLRPPAGSIVAFYVADVWHLVALISVARQHPGVRFIANLMRSHRWIEEGFDDSNPLIAGMTRLLVECLDACQGTNVHITVDTAALADDVARLSGVTLPTWPMIATSKMAGAPLPGRPGATPLHLLAPTHATRSKGYVDLAELAGRLKERIEEGEITLTVRRPANQPGFQDGTSELADKIVSNGGRISPAAMSDDEFVDLIRSADVVLIPYRRDTFRTRTSAVVVDALLAAKPVVATQGTWVGDIVERYGAGRTYEEGNIDDMVSALVHVEANLDTYRERLEQMRGQIIDEFSPARLIRFFRSLSETGRLPDPARLDRARTSLQDLRRLHRWMTVSQEEMRLRYAIQHDDWQRQYNNGLDKLEEMRRRDVRALRKIEQLKARSRHPSRPLAEHVYVRNAHAHVDEMQVVARVIDPWGEKPGHMVDVGAHHGSAFRYLLQRGWRVTAFEPDSRHLEYLKDRYGNDERVIVDDRAVIDVSGGDHTLYISEESSGVSTLSPFLQSHLPAGYVRTTALADVLDEHIEVLKIDTEGMDLFVLQGYPWDRDTPDVILCEFEDIKTAPLGYRLDDLGQFLLDRGYQVWMSEWHPVIRYGRKHDWHRLMPYPCVLSTPDAWGNLIAFKKPVKESTLASALEESLTVENRSAHTKARAEEFVAHPKGGDNAQVREVSDDLNDSTRKRSYLLSRRAGVTRALRGSMRAPATVAAIMCLLAAVLAVAGLYQGAILATVGAIIASLTAAFLVAVRVERRLTASTPTTADIKQHHRPTESGR